MTLTTPERLQVDGHDLKTLATNVETLAATLRAASKRTQNVTVAGKHGTFFVSRKKFDQLVLTWPMWVIGVDEDGQIPVGQTERERFFANVDELIRIMHGEELRQLEIRHTLPDGSVRIAYGEVVDTIDLTTSGVNPTGRVIFEMVLSDPFWRGEGEIVREIPLGTVWTPGTSWELVELAGSNAPIEDAVVDIYGPSDEFILQSGPDLSVSTTIDGTGYDSTEILRIDSGTHEILKSGSTRELERTNLSLNPSVETNATGYLVNGGVGGVPARVSAGQTVSGAWCAETTASGPGQVNIRLHPLDVATTTAMGYAVQKTYIWSVWVRLRSSSPTTLLDMRLRAAFWTNTTFISSVSGTIVSVARATSDNNSNGWYQLFVSGEVPLNTTRVEFNFFTGNVVLNDKINFDAILIEEGVLPGDFFDGNSPACSWRGTANNSQSDKWVFVRQNVHPNPSGETSIGGYSNNGGVGGIITRESLNGAKSGSFYLNSVAGGPGNLNIFLHQNTDAQFQSYYPPGQQFTWSVYVRYASGPGVDRAFELKADFSNAGAFLSGVTTGFVVVTKDGVNWTRITLTGTVPGGTTRVAFYLICWGCVATDTINIDAAQIEPGAVATEYFDGNTAGAEWGANPDLSDSYIPVSSPPGVFVPVTNFQYITHKGDSRYVYLSPDVDGKYWIGVDGVTDGSTAETKLIIRTAHRFKTG